MLINTLQDKIAKYSASNSKWWVFVQYLLIALPAIVYLGFVMKYAINAPRQDDYDAILSFLLDFKKANGSEKISLLFSQHNEHRIFFSRLLFVAYLKVAGSINFRGIIFINYALLVLLFLLVSSFARKLLPERWKLAAFIISLCLFNINGYENGNFAMAGTQNLGVIMLFMASIYFYEQRKVGMLPLAALMQMVCVFTSGNGNVAVFFIVVYTIMGRYKPAMVVSIVLFLLVSPLYYYHYSAPPSGFFSADPTRFIPYFIHVIGAHFGSKLSVFAGVGILIAAIVLAPFEKGGKIKEGAIPFICIIAFAFCSTGVLSVFRSALPVESAYSSRYFIYSNIITTILALMFLIKIRGWKWQMHTTVLLLLGLVFFYRRNVKEGKDGFIYIYNNIMEHDYDYPDQVRAKTLTDESCKQGIYCIEGKK